MRSRLICAFALLHLTACDGQKLSIGGSSAGDALDEKAIATGVIPDPANITLAGRFETRSELGTDKFCAVEQGGTQHKIGVLAVFGPESKCEARGGARANGGKISLSFKGEGSCEFETEFDGISIRFPGSLPEGCASYCTPRASFAGTSYFMVEHGNDNARKALGRDFEKLCD